MIVKVSRPARESVSQSQARPSPSSAAVTDGPRLYDTFLRANPEFDATSTLDALRGTEYARLDAQDHVYLDYTGGGLYAERQVREHLALLTNGVFGNPHSKNLTSLAMADLVEQTRDDVLRFFNASPDEYMVVFTTNATGALKLVGESYPFVPGSILLLTADNHNSVNGIREFARRKSAAVRYVPLMQSDLRIDRDALTRELAAAPSASHKLFGFPAQSNFSGVQHPLGWISDAQAQGWQVLVDAASFVPSNRLDLSRVHPDFVALSFYKMFGYPTGVGCLIARKAAAATLVRPWYAGGTITFSTVASLDHYLTPGPAGFEDGTLNYLSLPAVSIGLDYIDSIGLDVIHTRVMCLTGWLLDQLSAIRHSSGSPVVRVYGPTDVRQRGGTIQTNFFDRDGVRIDCYRAEQMANSERISLRAGCHCNPGAREAAFGFSREDVAACFRHADRISYDEFQHQIEGKTTGALRLSVGLASNFEDVSRYLEFARSFVDRSVSDLS
jgi:selenocysteine lyase/cysteine desulfurase